MQILIVFLFWYDRGVVTDCSDLEMVDGRPVIRGIVQQSQGRQGRRKESYKGGGHCTALAGMSVARNHIRGGGALHSISRNVHSKESY